MPSQEELQQRLLPLYDESTPFAAVDYVIAAENYLSGKPTERELTEAEYHISQAEIIVKASKESEA